MPQLLAFLLPLGLAAAVSPMMLSEQVVLLGTRRGVAAAAAYAAGTATVTVLLVAAVLALGTHLQLPTTPHLDATLDLWLGGALLLLVLAVVVWHLRHAHRPRPARAHPHDVRPTAAYAFGVLSMATNITTLALLLPASKEIAASNVAEVGKLVAAALLVGLACLPAWAPLSVVVLAPGASTDLLGMVQRAIERHGRTVILVFLAGLSLFLLGRGVYRLEWMSAPG